MTEEERMAMVLAGMKNPYTTPATTMESQVAKQLATIDPGKIPAYNRKQDLQNQAAQSTAGQASKLKNQAAYARGLRNTAMPKGQSVGPSGIYVNNIWDSAEAGLSRALGGYLEGQLSDDYAAIDTAETAKGAAALELEDVNTGEQRGFEKALADIKIEADSARAALDRTSREGIAARNNEVTTRGQDLTAGTAAGNRDATNTRDVETTSFFNPKAGEPGESPALTYYLRNGRVEDGTGNEVDVTGLTPYKALSPQSLDAAGAKPTAAQVEEKGEADASLRSRTGRFANMDKLATYSLEDARNFTGYNPQALGGKFAAGPQGVKAQQFNQMTATEEVGGLLPAIKDAKLTPVSDKDVNIVREQFVNARSQPETMAQFYAYGGRQFMDNTIKHNIGLGNISAAEGAQIQQEYDMKAATLAMNWGYPPEDLVTAGMDPEMVSYLAEAKKRGDI